MPVTSAYAAGFLFSLSLIVAIGAQNAFVLRQGALRAHVGVVVTICSLSDVGLIAAGVAGVGALVTAAPGALVVIRIIGAALLLGYGALAARRAIRGGAGNDGLPGASPSRRRVIASTLGFTWLNPNVYLDTLVLLGTVASVHHHTRWWFGAGAASASVIWFVLLGIGSALLGPVLRRPGSARALDGFVAVVMVVTAVRTLAL